jgi:tyrosyl-tRNA synthetase
VAEIAKMKRETHPMEAKKDLARRIVTDFHGADAAGKAGQDWAKQFQKDEIPEELEVESVKIADVIDPSDLAGLRDAVAKDLNYGARIKLAKLLHKMRLAESVSDGERKLKQNAVSIGGSLKNTPMEHLNWKSKYVVKVGRKPKQLQFTTDGI